MELKYVENLVLEGGGVKGLAFLGALEYLEGKDVLRNIKRVAGSSAGCIYAVAVALKLNSKVIKDEIRKVDFSSFKDDTWGYVLDVFRVINHYGICKGDAIYDWFGDLLEKYTGDANITFQQLYNITKVFLVITGTNVNKCKTEYFSYETTPNMPIRLAMRISTSIPLFFSAVQMNGDIYIDGGLLNNYPIWYFDKCYKTNVSSIDDKLQRMKTLGLKLMGDNEYKTHDNEISMKRKEIANIKNFIVVLIDAMILQIEKGYIEPGYWKRTVVIDTGNIATTDFRLSQDKIDWLIYQGYDACTYKFG